MKSKFIIFLCVQILINPLVFSQISTSGGYIIKNNNDTVYGKLEFLTSGNSNRCNFIEQNSKKIEYLRSDQIKQYCIGQKLSYHAIPYKQGKVFFKVMSSGKLNLYSFKQDLYIFNEAGEITRLTGGEKIIEMNGKRFIQKNEYYKIQLKEQIEDTSLYAHIDELNFDTHEIIGLVRQYNGESPVYKPNIKPDRKNSFEFIIGTTVSKQIVENDPIAFRPFFGDRIEVNNTLTAYSNFIGISYKRKLLSDNFFLKTSLIYEKAEKQHYIHKWDLSTIDLVILTGLAEHQLEDGDYTMQNETKMDLSSVNLPVAINYSMSNGRLRPFIDLGLTGKICLSRKILSTQEIFKDGDSFKFGSVNSILDPIIMGLNLGLGSNYLINMNSSIGTGCAAYFYLPVNDYFNKIFELGFYLSYSF